MTKPHPLIQSRLLDHAADLIERAVVMIEESDHGLIADELSEVLERVRSRADRIEREHSKAIAEDTDLQEHNHV